MQMNPPKDLPPEAHQKLIDLMDSTIQYYYSQGFDISIGFCIGNWFVKGDETKTPITPAKDEVNERAESFFCRTSPNTPRIQSDFLHLMIAQEFLNNPHP